jgi:hypothetical protein
LGFTAEAGAYMSFIEQRIALEASPGTLQIVYGIRYGVEK